MIALFNEKQRDSDNNVGFPKEKNQNREIQIIMLDFPKRKITLTPLQKTPRKKSRKPKTEKGSLKNQKLFKNNPTSQRFNKTPETLNNI